MRHVQAERALSEIWPEEIAGSEIDVLIDGLHDLIARLSGALNCSTSGCVEGVNLSRIVRDILRFRKHRNRFFGGDLFGEPAWDMLLELYVAKESGRKLSVSGACYVSGVPLSTALRWISRLEKDRLVQRVNDPTDARRTWLVLSEEAERKMDNFLTLTGAFPS